MNCTVVMICNGERQLPHIGYGSLKLCCNKLKLLQLNHILKIYKKYPTLKSIQDASEDEILTLWSGLGFYKRARNIFQTKEIIHSEHKGRFPKLLKKSLSYLELANQQPVQSCRLHIKYLLPF